MCLLINQPAAAPVLPAHWLTDFFNHNGDGVGVMYCENGSLVTEKILPASAADFIGFYEQHIAGKQCAFHLRMRTHGATDFENCHPYTVLTRAEHGIDLALMHNGILSTGNAADISKSDTWHYIADYLRPMLANNPDFFTHPAFSALIGDHIGSSNKFILMDNKGRTVTINESAGVYWGGVWLSNTYAWAAPASTSKQPPKNSRKAIKAAAQQVRQQPRQRPAITPYAGYYNTRQTNWAAGYEWGDDTYTGYAVNSRYQAPAIAAPAYDNDYLSQEIEEYVDTLSRSGYHHAALISFNSCLDFCERYGIEQFSELCEMVLDGDISEDWLIRAVSDDHAAREMFDWLKPLTVLEQ